MHSSSSRRERRKGRGGGPTGRVASSPETTWRVSDQGRSAPPSDLHVAGLLSVDTTDCIVACVVELHFQPSSPPGGGPRSCGRGLCCADSIPNHLVSINHLPPALTHRHMSSPREAPMSEVTSQAPATKTRPFLGLGPTSSLHWDGAGSSTGQGSPEKQSPQETD